ncbi:MAG: Nif3-like dinuclear metal center hexameric protein [Bacteroidales bacterium]|nr:Nif3-like dinuclear metal center hexameric protein [Bacteroidales bacterium]
MKIKSIITLFEEAAPSALKETYDNVGLLIGNPDEDVRSALICLDVTEEVMDEALKHGCDLIISHHPLIFGGLKKITGANAVERLVIRAIRDKIAVYAVHTNLDNVWNGVNAMLCRQLGLRNTGILQALEGKLNKLVTFCPDGHADQVRKALFDAGGGHIGNYDSCSYNLEGFGTFRGGENTNPFVGERGKLHRENEMRIEVIFPEYLRSKLLSALRHSHPYEEVAFDIYPLMNAYEQAGAGMIGMFDQEMGEEEFLLHIKNILGTGVIRHSALTGRQISRVAVCGGSGDFLIGRAMAAGADAYITADVKYHQFFEADGRMLIADAGHYETEQFTKELLYNVLNEKFPTFALRISHSNTNAVHYF